MSTKTQIKKPSTKIKTYSPEQFARLSVNTQKRLILEDAIAQLRIKKFKATPGTYASLETIDIKKTGGQRDEYGYINFEGKDARDLINNSGTCQVCAIGGLFMSMARVGDGCPMEDFGEGYPSSHDDTKATIEFENDLVFEKLEQYFDKDIYVMEAAFEGSVVNEDGFASALGFIDEDDAKDSDNGESYKYYQMEEHCKAFYKKYKNNATTRLIAILENTLRNKLKFTPVKTSVTVNP